MFYQIQHLSNDNDRRLIDSYLIEAPSRERAADYVRMEHERTGHYTIMQRIYTADDGVAPPGWTYQKKQIWVEGLDTGWCRKWVKDSTLSDHEQRAIRSYIREVERLDTLGLLSGNTVHER